MPIDPPHSRRRASRPLLVPLAVLAIAYAALAALGLRWTSAQQVASPIFPAAGVALAGLALGGLRLWPAIFLGTLSALRWSGSSLPLPVELWFATGTTLAAAGAVALMRLARFSPELGRGRDALALIGIGAVGGPAVSATIGILTLATYQPMQAWSATIAWLTWFTGDAVGVLVVAPPVLAWGASRAPRSTRWWMHLGACAAVALVVAVAVFVLDPGHHPIGWYSLVPLVWAALAFQARGSAVLLLVATAAVWGTATGTGPFAIDTAGPWRFVFVQQFVAVAAATTLIVGTLADERRGKERLREAQQRLAMALSAGKMGVWSCSPATGVARWDEAFASLTGLGDSGAAGSSVEAFLSRVHPQDRQQARANIERLLATGGQFESEFRFLRPDGTAIWLAGYGTAATDRHGRIWQLTGVNFDITARKQAEQALRDGEARSQRQLQELDTVYQTAPIGMWLGDREGRFLRVNEVLAAMNGQPVEAHIGRGVREMMPGVADTVEPPYRHVLATGEPVLGLEVVGRTPALPGVDRDWVMSWYPLLDEHGQVVAVSAIVQEVTEQRRAQAALVDAARRKDEFLATLAHELRNPLAPIRTGLQLLKRAPADSPVAAQAREMMERQLVHMVRLVDDLLDVSRISRGKVELKRERVALEDILATAIEASRPNLDAGRHALAVRRAPEALYLHADADRLAQVVSNLLNNAAKYTPQGGHVELAVAREGAEAVLRVSDDGVGIAAEMLPRVFEIFTQVGRTLDRAQGGLGIGLSIVKQLVELHGGSVRVDSRGPGQGSTFTVRLPLAAMRASDPPQEPPAGQSRLKRVA